MPVAGDVQAVAQTQEVQQAARQGKDVSALKERARQLKERIRHADAEHDQAEAELRDLLLGIPNLPLDEVPDGDSEDFAVEIRRHGDPTAFAFEPKDHVDLGEAMGILDFARAAKLSGPRFSIARGTGAALGRALATFFLDLHIRRHGYTEYSLPNLVTREIMTGTGQLRGGSRDGPGNARPQAGRADPQGRRCRSGGRAARDSPTPDSRRVRSGNCGGASVLLSGDQGFVEVCHDRIDRLLRRHVRGIDPQAHARHGRLEFRVQVPPEREHVLVAVAVTGLDNL